jgi:hypothetical protein
MNFLFLIFWASDYRRLIFPISGLWLQAVEIIDIYLGGFPPEILHLAQLSGKDE